MVILIGKFFIDLERYKYQTVSLAIAPPNTSIEYTIFSKEQHPAAKQAALLHSDLVSVTGGF